MADEIILPGATIGVLGGGQLGRMLGIAARAMGYGFTVYADAAGSPASAVADSVTVGDHADADAVRVWARGADVVTWEFENVDAGVAEAVRGVAPVRPDGKILHTTQNRLREKTWLLANGFPIATFAPVPDKAHFRDAMNAVGFPAVIKTASGGYDGKGQWVVRTPGDALAAQGFFGDSEIVIERLVEFDREISVVVARGLRGEIRAFAPTDNRHASGILDVTISPAALPLPELRDAQILAAEIADEMGYVGVLCVEMFRLPDGTLLVNEIAPRPHNSGHHTIESCATSQFAQQVRAICGLPLGDTTQPRPAAMANLLGDLWANGRPDWAAAMAIPGVALHLYGKTEARAGRKMGHLTACADTAEEAEERVLRARAALWTRKV